MTTIMPDQKRLKDALKWLGEQEQAGQDIAQLISAAGFRFNLTPNEEQYLLHIFRQKEQENPAT